MVGDIVAFAIGAKAPSVIGATDAVAVDIATAAVNHHIRGVVGGRQMGFHVGAVSVQQDHLACGPTTVKSKVFAENRTANGLCVFNSSASAIMNQPLGKVNSPRR